MAIGDDEWDGDWSVETADDIIAEEVDGKANAALIAAAPDLYAALEETWRILDAAGLLNLSRGVQLGATSWFVKASDAERLSMSALTKARGEQP